MFKMMQKKYLFFILCLGFTNNALTSMKKPLARLSRRALHELHQRIQTETAPHMPSKYYIEKPHACTDEKLNSVFELLQQRMNFCRIIPLFTSPVLIKGFSTFLDGVFNPRPHAIILSEHELNGTTPTAKFALLISLLRFGQYHKENKNQLEYKEAKQKSHEFAINALAQCESCLNVLRTTYYDHKNFSSQFDFLQKKCKNQNCKGHIQALENFEKKYKVRLSSEDLELIGLIPDPKDRVLFCEGIFFNALDEYVLSLEELIPNEFPKLLPLEGIKK